MREPDLHRLPETAATLLKPDGSVYRAGEVFKQPAVARTLRAVVSQGADYLYRGDWAAKLVRAVQSDGGHLALEDLAGYEVLWPAPRRTTFGDYELALLGPPNQGAVSLIEALNLAMAAGIPKLGHWSGSAESLRRLSDVTTMFYLSFIPQAVREQLYPGLDLSDESRMRPETAEALWDRMEQGVRPFAYTERAPTHSDVVVAVDRDGNMTAITHSINSVIWGKTALVVDGISTGDPGAFQQTAIAAVGPGKRLPDPTEVGIALRDGRPILAFASMATGLHQQTVQSLLNTLVFGMSVKEAVDAPAIFLPLPDGSMPPRQSMRVMEGAFPEAILRDTGLPFVEIPAAERRFAQGLWVGIWRDPATGTLSAASPPYASGRALAY